MRFKNFFLPFLAFFFIAVILFSSFSGCETMKGDHYAIQQDQDMVREVDDDLALMKKLRKEEAGENEEHEEDGESPKKEKSKGIFFLSDRGNQIRDNLER